MTHFEKHLIAFYVHHNSVSDFAANSLALIATLDTNANPFTHCSQCIWPIRAYLLNVEQERATSKLLAFSLNQSRRQQGNGLVAPDAEGCSSVSSRCWC